MIRRPFALVLTALTLSASGVSGSDAALVLSSPANGARVPWRACLEGSLVGSMGVPVPVVHPLESSDYYVQPAVSIFEGGRRFKVMAFFGENGRAHLGKRFEVMVLQRPKRPLREGQLLSYWPEADLRSEVVEVVRDDDADSGCDRTAIGSTDRPEQAAARVGAGPGRSESDPSRLSNAEQTAPMARDPYQSSLAWVCLPWLIWVMFLALAVRPEEAIRMDRRLGVWVGWGTVMLRQLFDCTIDTCTRFVRFVVKKTAAEMLRIWSSKGLSVTGRGFLLSALRGAALLPTVFLMTIADALAIRSGLVLVLPSAEASSAILDGVLTIAPQDVTVAAGTLTSSSGPTLGGLLAAVAPIWEGPVGLMALGLATVQAVIGIALLVGMDKNVSTSTPFSALWRLRPMPTILFVVLNMTLAFLAANRGYEHSPGEISAVMPTALAFLLASVMPWLLAYALHLLFESTADVLAVVGAVVALVVMIVAALAVATGGSVALLAIVTVAAAVLVLSIFGRLTAGLFLWLAVVFGKAGRTMYRFVVETLRTGSADADRRVRLRATATLVLALLWTSIASAQTPSADTARHDPRHAYKALVLCIDTSTSLHQLQFAKAKQVLSAIAVNDVGPNDLVWLMLISERNVAAQLFEIPYVDTRRSSQAHLSDVKAAKEGLRVAIARLEQSASRTDLRDPIEMALHLLLSRAGASSRTIVIASDFIEDLAQRQVTAAPPSFTVGTSAIGIRVALLHAHPIQRYLNSIGLSAAELFGTVQKNWTDRFRQLGATTTSIALVDALAAN